MFKCVSSIAQFVTNPMFARLYRVIVMDNGVIKEFDEPANLLRDKQSVFYGMAVDAGLV